MNSFSFQKMNCKVSEKEGRSHFLSSFLLMNVCMTLRFMHDFFKIKYETAKYRTVTNRKSLHKLLNISIIISAFPYCWFLSLSLMCVLSHFIPGAHITFKLLITQSVEHVLDKLHSHCNRFSI